MHTLPSLTRQTTVTEIRELYLDDFEKKKKKIIPRSGNRLSRYKFSKFDHPPPRNSIISIDHHFRAFLVSRRDNRDVTYQAGEPEPGKEWYWAAAAAAAAVAADGIVGLEDGT